MRNSGVHPVVVLGLVLAVPALVFGAAWRWAGAQAAAPVSRPSIEVRLDRALSFAVDDGHTRLQSWRRLADAVGLDSDRLALATAVDEVAAGLDDPACIAVALDGRPVAASNETEALIPASLQKIVVAAVALEILGPDHRYTTAAAGASDAAGVVGGDLYLIGGGDPLLTSDWYPTAGLQRNPVIHPTRLEGLADGVVAAGVRRIEGRVIGDGSRYDDERFAPGWGPGVPGVSAGPYGALMVNDSRRAESGAVGDDPALVAADEFIRLLGERGITVGGGAGVGRAPADTPVVATVESAPMAQVVDELLLTSDNNTAELLVKEIGHAAGDGGRRTAGLAIAESVLRGWGIDLDGVVLADGSGLSLDNRLTCRAVLGILGRYGIDQIPATSFPIAGESGTLQAYFGDTAVGGRLRGKTGTLGNPPADADPPAVKALAGYVPTDRSTIEYVMILVGPTITADSEFVPEWNRLAAALGSYPAGPDRTELGPR